uniref:exodeoxyribonuclease III n=1 Tax=Cyprinus carpio carpio TaxID=630221 RepID=A0A9J7XMZ7_CYPCA
LVYSFWVGHNIRIITWNVRGLGGQIKRSRVFSHLKTLSSDIMFLQETHLRMGDHIRFLLRSWVGQAFHSGFSCKARGTAILINKNPPFSPFNVISDPNGRFVIISGTFYDNKVTLASIYAPNWDNPDFFIKLFSKLPDLNLYQLIMGGTLCFKHCSSFSSSYL